MRGEGATEASRPGEQRSLFRLASTLAVLALLMAASLFFFKSVSVNAISTLLMATVLLVAVVFGLGHGLAAGVVALLAYQAFVGVPLTQSELASGDLPLMVLFGVGAMVVGRYTDIVRKRDVQARMLLQAGRPLSPHASDPGLGRFLESVRVEGRSRERTSALEEAQRALVSFCLVAAGLVAGLLVREPLGATAGALCVMASVGLVGALLGGRFGAVAGLLAAIILNQVDLLRGGLGLPASDAGQVFILALFAGVGWGVGRVADAAQQERRTLRTLMEAGRDVSANRNEASLRQALLEVLSRLSPRARVQITSDTTAERLDVSPVGSPTAWPDGDPRWRVHPLVSDGREVGVVRWRFPGSEAGTAELDDIARALIDLAASGVVRARLNAEKADMELVAQTEHLRLVLLDAVSHHFRSPLAGILGSVTSILSLPEQDAVARRELLFIIKEQTNRLSRYVDNFLSVARLETGAIVPKPADVPLEALIYDVWETFGDAGGSRRFLQASVECETLRTDPGLLAQVLGNVLENAIKYSPEGSIVEVTGEAEDDRFVIRVSDCGPGLPPQSQDRIFERFYRMRGVAAPGLGLGLYITRSLVEILGGSVRASNRTDGQSGLVVSVSLPIGSANADG